MEKYLETLKKLIFVINASASSQRIYVIYDPTMLTKKEARFACNEAIKKQSLSPITINLYTVDNAPAWVWDVTPRYRPAI